MFCNDLQPTREVSECPGGFCTLGKLWYSCFFLIGSRCRQNCQNFSCVHIYSMHFRLMPTNKTVQGADLFTFSQFRGHELVYGGPGSIWSWLESLRTASKESSGPLFIIIKTPKTRLVCTIQSPFFCSKKAPKLIMSNCSRSRLFLGSYKHLWDFSSGSCSTICVHIGADSVLTISLFQLPLS